MPDGLVVERLHDGLLLHLVLRLEPRELQRLRAQVRAIGLEAIGRALVDRHRLHDPGGGHSRGGPRAGRLAGWRRPAGLGMAGALSRGGARRAKLRAATGGLSVSLSLSASSFIITSGISSCCCFSVSLWPFHSSAV